MSQIILYTPKTNEKQPNDFGRKLFEKIDGGFFCDDFFKKVLGFIDWSETNDESVTVIEKYFNFVYECYIHGVDIGMETAAEIYTEKNK